MDTGEYEEHLSPRQLRNLDTLNEHAAPGVKVSVCGGATPHAVRIGWVGGRSDSADPVRDAGRDPAHRMAGASVTAERDEVAG